MSLTPTKLTLRHLREHDWPLVEVVEKWNHHAGIRQDLFGFVDVLAVGPSGVLAVQTTSAANFVARRQKIIEHENIVPVMEAGIAVAVHGWKKIGNRWVLHRHDFIEHWEVGIDG